MVVRSPCTLQPVKPQGSVSVSGLVVLVDEGQNIIFGQFLGVHPCLRVVDYDPVHPGPEVPLSVANTEGEDKGRKLLNHIKMLLSQCGEDATNLKGAAALAGIS